MHETLSVMVHGMVISSAAGAVLTDLWGRIKDGIELVVSFLTENKDAFRVLWEGSREETGTHIFIAICAIAAVLGGIALLVSFFRSSWKEKLRSIVVTAIALLVLGVIFWWALSSAA